MIYDVTPYLMVMNWHRYQLCHVYAGKRDSVEELNKYDRLNQCRFHHKEPLWTLASHLTSLNSHMELLKHLLTYTFKALTVKYVFTLITMTRRFDGFMVFLSSYEGGIDPNLGNTTFLFMMQEAFYNGELCGTKYNFHSLHFSAS